MRGGLMDARQEGCVAALALAERGLPVFPCTANKVPPKGSAGFLDATTDPARIRDLFRRHRGLIGVATGERSGLDALDIDSVKHPEAGDWLRQWEPIDTRRHQSRSGGSHLLFRHEPGLSNQQSYPVAGVDIRADGGYIIWWPAAGFEIRDFPIIRWPETLLAEAGVEGTLIQSGVRHWRTDRWPTKTESGLLAPCRSRSCRLPG